MRTRYTTTDIPSGMSPEETHEWAIARRKAYSEGSLEIEQPKLRGGKIAADSEESDETLDRPPEGDTQLK